MAFDTRDLQLGDILITLPSNAVSHCGIVAGTSEASAGPGRTVTRANIVFHATSGGMLKDPLAKFQQDRGKFDIYRLRQIGQAITTAPGGAAIRLQDRVVAVADQLVARSEYGKFRAFIRSWTGTSNFGPAAKGRMLTYLYRLNHHGTGNFAVFCSEYVILCYQLAMQGKEDAVGWIDLDGKHALPKDLRSWLVASAQWQHMGEA